MFRRRKPLSLLEKIRRQIWPRGGWKRALVYRWRRLQRLKDTPTAIARGFAIGAAMAVTPFIGLHIWLALGLSWLVGASLLATFAGTFVGNYLTIIPILLLEFEMGKFLFDAVGLDIGEPGAHITFRFLVEHPLAFSHELMVNPANVLPLVLPTLLGSAITAGITYIVFVALIRDSINNFREKRNHRIAMNKRRRGEA